MFNCSSQPCQYATFLPCIIISVIVGCSAKSWCFMTMTVVMMTVATCLPALATGKSCRPHALASLPLSLTHCTAIPPIHWLVIQARLLYRLVHYTPKARFRDSLWSAYCTKDTCIPKIVLPGRLQALFIIRNLLLTSNCIKLLESVTSAPKPQKDYI